MPEEPTPLTPNDNSSSETPPVTPAPQNTKEDALLQAVAEVENEPQPTFTPQDDSSLAINSDLPAESVVAKKSFSKKKLAAILAVVILLVFGVGGTAFALWFNSPNTVTDDAVKNLITSKTMINQGSYRYQDSESKSTADITFTSQTDVPKYAGALDIDAKIKYQDFSLNLSGSGMMAESGTIYFKLNNVTELVNKALETDYGKLYASSPKLQDAIKKLAAKLDHKWIRLDKSDVELYSSSFNKERTCDKTALVKFYDDQSQQKQIVDSYKNNRFFTVKSTGKSETINSLDSVGYSVSYSAKIADDFDQALQKTTISKALDKCANTDNSTNAKSSETKPSAKEKQDQIKSDQKEADKTKTTIWISRWSHQITKIESTTKDKTATSNLNATFQPNQTLKLSDPKDYLDAKDLQKDFEDISTLASEEAFAVPSDSPSEPVRSSL